jgi:hypothetical protein
MKAFLAGLIFLVAVAVFGVIGVLLFPLLIVMAWFLRLILSFVLLILAIWLLGKFIIFTWDKLKNY